jgi:hypothetical protein
MYSILRNTYQWVLVTAVTLNHNFYIRIFHSLTSYRYCTVVVLEAIATQTVCLWANGGDHLYLAVHCPPLQRFSNCVIVRRMDLNDHLTLIVLKF